MVALLSVKGAVQQGGSHPKGQSERGAGGADAGLIFAVRLFLFILLLLLSLLLLLFCHTFFLCLICFKCVWLLQSPSQQSLAPVSFQITLSIVLLSRTFAATQRYRPPRLVPTLVSLPHFNPPASLSKPGVLPARDTGT